MLARQAAAARDKKEEMDSGDQNDIAAISNLLPYCDAIFVDRAWHGRLGENPAKNAIGKFRARVFSSRNIDEFMQFLDGIEAAASKEILNRIEKVFGDIEEKNPLDDIDLY